MHVKVDKNAQFLLFMLYSASDPFLTGKSLATSFFAHARSVFSLWFQLA